MRILALDPGGTTGLAFGDFEGGAHDTTTRQSGPLPTCADVEMMLGSELWDPDLVVCESFIPRPGVRTWQPDALEVIGAVRYLCWRDGVEFALQSPADAKRFSTDERLKKIGWYQPGRDHANDALRHLLLAAVRRNVFPKEEL